MQFSLVIINHNIMKITHIILKVHFSVSASNNTITIKAK